MKSEEVNNYVRVVKQSSHYVMPILNIDYEGKVREFLPIVGWFWQLRWSSITLIRVCLLDISVNVQEPAIKRSIYGG